MAEMVDLQPGLLYLSAVSADPEVKVIRQLLAVGIRFVSLQQSHKRSIIHIHACIGLVSQLKAKTTGISILNHSCTCMATIDRCKGRHNCENYATDLYNNRPTAAIADKRRKNVVRVYVLN